MISGGNSANHQHHEVFSAKKASHLDTRFRQFLYRPDRLAEKYVQPGNRVLDFGCGPGFFTRAFAQKTGEGGQVVAVDLQEEMLAILREKLGNEGLLPRIRTHRCAPDTIGLPTDLNGTFDVAFAIFVIHEVPDKEKHFREICMLLKPGSTFFYTEPPFIVPGKEFRENLAVAQKVGFRLIETSHYFVNRAALLRKE